MVFEGIIACSKAALEHDIPVVLGNDVGCPWITQYDFWRELYYFHKYVGDPMYLHFIRQLTEQKSKGQQSGGGRVG